MLSFLLNITSRGGMARKIELMEEVCSNAQLCIL